MGSPYRAFQADSPTALEEAIEEVGRQENARLEYAEIQPRREFELLFLCSALIVVVLLVAARRWELAA
jgi:mxaC protein